MSPYRLEREESLMVEFLFRALLLIEITCATSRGMGKSALIVAVIQFCFMTTY